MATNSAWRPLADWERGILDRFFECEFPERERLRPQLDRLSCKVIDEYDDDYGSLEFRVAGLPEPEGGVSPHAEGEYLDDDGVPIWILLFIRDNQLWELEILRADGGRIIRKPSAELFNPRSMFDGSSRTLQPPSCPPKGRTPRRRGQHRASGSR
ncbi:MAG: hypothetical protein O3A53_11570 [Acidobacteria bacterium]|nr:hypothetical protein [Acidobacteriota bacterium]MDA1235429.1 hypothetical protein [Acidobacteriota bacterium]